jgi:hypothetical protein
MKYLARMSILLFVAFGGLTQDSKNLLPSSVLVFHGMVIRELSGSRKDANVPDLLLRVEGDPIKEPSAGFLRDGDTVLVTLVSGSSPALKVGSEATFYCKDVDFGELIHVYELGHELFSSATRKQDNTTGRVSVSLADTELLARVDSAQAVFGGIVTKITASGPQETGQNTGLSSLSQDEKPTRISEHDPNWQDATIAVSVPVKSDKDLYVVRFPASRDHLWVRFPKLSVGQKGTFILKTINSKNGQLVSLPSGEPVYKLESADEVLNLDQAGALKSLMEKQGRQVNK